MLEHDLCYVNLADFLKTKSNQTKFAAKFERKVVKRLFFLNPRSYKMIVTKEKDRRKKQERGAGRKGGEEEKTMAALSVFIIAT